MILEFIWVMQPAANPASDEHSFLSISLNEEAWKFEYIIKTIFLHWESIANIGNFPCMEQGSDQ